MSFVWTSISPKKPILDLSITKIPSVARRLTSTTSRGGRSGSSVFIKVSAAS